MFLARRSFLTGAATAALTAGTATILRAQGKAKVRLAYLQL
jgi:hypothetical protein